MNDPHEVTLKILDRPFTGTIYLTSMRETEPKQFLDIGSACQCARRESKAITRKAIIQVIEKRTGRIKLRIDADGNGGTVETPLV